MTHLPYKISMLEREILEHSKRPFNVEKLKKWRQAWTFGRFSEVATALRLLPLKAFAQKVQDQELLKNLKICPFFPQNQLECNVILLAGFLYLYLLSYH